ncbi:MAG: Spy/CpxP family protein refolding chaperone [Bdellovibrio sp.]
MRLFLKTFILVGAFALASGNAGARSEGRSFHKGDDMVPMEGHFTLEKMKKLNLSEEQTEKLKKIREAHKEDIQKHREEMKDVKKAFKKSIRSNASKEEIQKAFDTMIEKKGQLARMRLNNLLEAREVLTEEQRAKLFEKGP